MEFFRGEIPEKSLRDNGFRLRRFGKSHLNTEAFSDILIWGALKTSRLNTVRSRPLGEQGSGNEKCGVSLKERMEKGRQEMIRLLPGLVFVFCLLQPLLDVAGFWQGELGVKTVLTTLLRFGCFGGAALLGFWLTDRKWVYVLMAGIMAAFAGVRSWALLEAGYRFPMEDLINLFTFYMLPVYTLAFGTFTLKNPRVVRAIMAGFAADLAIVAAVMVLSRLTGTDPYTYPNKELGVQGWFLHGNPQSAILSMLVPVAMGWALEKWEDKVLPLTAMTLMGELCLYFLGTRLSCMAMVASGVGIAVCLLLIDRTRWRQSVAVGAVTVVLTLLIPFSPMVENQRRQADNFDLKQQAFDAIAMVDDETADEQTRTDRLVEAYRLYVPGLVTRFGGERTLDAYNHTTDVDIVGARRTMRLTFCRLLREDSPESAKWFGMDITRMKVEGVDLNWSTGEKEYMVTSFDPENDFHAVYYLYGLVGLGLILGFFAWLGGGALWAMFRDFRRHFTVEFAAIAIGCCCALAHCVFTASILRFSNSLAYFAVLLAGIWSLSRRERSAKRMKGFWKKG